MRTWTAIGCQLPERFRSAADAKIPLVSTRPLSPRTISRRTFLRGMRWASMVFLPAPFLGPPFPSLLNRPLTKQEPPFDFADLRLNPRYPAKSPLDDVLRL